MGLLDYIRWNSFFILSTRGRNIHEDTRSNYRNTWRILHVQRYIDTYKYIYGLVKASHLCFKECIKTMTLKTVFKKYKTNSCLLYQVNELNTVIVIVYVDETLAIWDKPALMDKIECIKKECNNWSVGEL